MARSGAEPRTRAAARAPRDVVEAPRASPRAVEPRLVVLRADPLNCEAPLAALSSGATPTSQFYVRNHFPVPALDASTWQLAVSGLVRRPLRLGLGELRGMRASRLLATVECAGNGRALLSPPVQGEPWGLGAVSTAEWEGVPLVEVLERAGLDPAARELLFRGADRGAIPGARGPVRFERSLTPEAARTSDALLAYAMNGEPLPPLHGYPLRLVVPGWYGVASVKWLTEIVALDRPFAGPFQTERYHYEWSRAGGVVREPVTLQRVRAIITEPAHAAQRARGPLVVRGLAWSGAAPITRVEVSICGGTWLRARLSAERHRHAWRAWELRARIDRPGRIWLRARATDRAGRTQPERPEWNRLGYGGNAIHALFVDVS